ncbi:3D-(3,5/4)-trihydroxycyclohexane-1,2-dione acylhydrolase (decyclizing) [Micromonospora sp. RTGN7]|uniref:3D-(3,5/4)-trihydroxycyclohexane-1,2-dione acylhydrolase (decyclizing) n=1 Tax=Micromonospora sp. RTGN7 TaxID=3016526 RepID=UPI0029FF3636|nr:3D-(3,5/4)-trihydroxycyclohexane-1,2-dione acylhydrolase (decyclizing) [Micromonospora sp. RTGN7]
MKLTVAQATIRFLANQYSERDGRRHRLIAGCFGIFGHGNVAGLGQALRQAELDGDPGMTYYQCRNEQAMVHTAVAYARMTARMSTFACTTSIGPGATNLVTGAALATVNRLPVLLLPGDIFATRVANPVLQELEDSRSYDVSVNDTLRPVSRFWDRVNRPEQLPAALLAAMRVLTDPAETGAVTLAMPQDVQAEAYDWPDELFTERTWYVPRPVPEPAALARAAQALRAAHRPLIVAGGGVTYSDANDELASFARRTGIPVAETQAGRGALPHDHPCAVGPIGVTGSTAANALAAEADVVLGIGTRYADFTTASRSLFAEPSVRFVNLNVAAFDAAKLGAVSLVADAREGLRALDAALPRWQVSEERRKLAVTLTRRWDDAVDEARRSGPGPLTQSQLIGAVNDAAHPADVVVCAAGSMPGDLHKLWRPASPRQYHVEYGYSCMGYEIAGGLGVKLAQPDAEVFVLVGDGSYLMMAQELVTAVAEGLKLVVVLVDNGGYASIGALSEQVGGARFGTVYRYRNPVSGRIDGQPLPVDLAANAASLGADVLTADTLDEVRAALVKGRAAATTTVVHVRTELGGPGSPANDTWWDVPVAAVSTTPDGAPARQRYLERKATQRGHWSGL